VFGLALTLLVVSAMAPRSYAELAGLVRGIPAFACCFALLAWSWHEPESFFDRYPGEDTMTMILNSTLLFFVLLYVYSLRFIFDAFMLQVFGLQGRDPVVRMTSPELASPFTLYGIGFCVLMLLFAGLYFHAHRRRSSLGPTALQAFNARALGGHHVMSALVGAAVAGVAWFGPNLFAFLAPACFALMGPAHWLFGRRMARLRPAPEQVT
jgi:hypothetical protein